MVKGAMLTRDRAGNLIGSQQFVAAAFRAQNRAAAAVDQKEDPGVRASAPGGLRAAAPAGLTLARRADYRLSGAQMPATGEPVSRDVPSLPVKRFAHTGNRSKDRALATRGGPVNHFTVGQLEEAALWADGHHTDLLPHADVQVQRTRRGRQGDVTEAALAALLPPTAGLGGPLDLGRSYEEELEELVGPGLGSPDRRSEGRQFPTGADGGPSFAGLALAGGGRGKVPVGGVVDPVSGRRMLLRVEAPIPSDRAPRGVRERQARAKLMTAPRDRTKDTPGYNQLTFGNLEDPDGELLAAQLRKQSSKKRREQLAREANEYARKEAGPDVIQGFAMGMLEAKAQAPDPRARLARFQHETRMAAGQEGGRGLESAAAGFRAIPGEKLDHQRGAPRPMRDTGLDRKEKLVFREAVDLPEVDGPGRDPRSAVFRAEAGLDARAADPAVRDRSARRTTDRQDLEDLGLTIGGVPARREVVGVADRAGPANPRFQSVEEEILADRALLADPGRRARLLAALAQLPTGAVSQDAALAAKVRFAPADEDLADDQLARRTLRAVQAAPERPSLPSRPQVEAEILELTGGLDRIRPDGRSLLHRLDTRAQGTPGQAQVRETLEHDRHRPAPLATALRLAGAEEQAQQPALVRPDRPEATERGPRPAPPAIIAADRGGQLFRPHGREANQDGLAERHDFRSGLHVPTPMNHHGIVGRPTGDREPMDTKRAYELERERRLTRDVTGLPTPGHPTPTWRNLERAPEDPRANRPNTRTVDQVESGRDLFQGPDEVAARVAQREARAINRQLETAARSPAARAVILGQARIVARPDGSLGFQATPQQRPADADRSDAQSTWSAMSDMLRRHAGN